MRAQERDYRGRLNPFLTDSKLQGEYPGGYRGLVGKDGHSLHFGGTDSDEEHVGRTSLREDDSDVVVDPPRPPSS